MIPKIIWQTHNYEYSNLPEHIFKCAKTWQNLNPRWRYIYFSHKQREDLIKKEVPDLYKIYMSAPPMHQADLWRYLVVHKHGGVYADMDSVCHTPLDYMLQNYNGEDVIFTKPEIKPEDKKNYVNNAHFAAVRKSQSLQKAINYITERKKYQLMVTSHLAFDSNLNIKDAKMYFDCAYHSEDYKTVFPKFDVNYFGSSMLYNDYLKNILKLNENDYNISKY